jgi:hypothetical protein
MSSPLPKLPANPLGDLPDNPLGAPPRPPLIGSREPLRLPVGRKLRRGGGRSTKAPLPSLTRPQGHQAAQKPQVVQVINRPAPAAPAASQPATKPAGAGGRQPVASLRTHAVGYLGTRAGGRVNSLSPKAQAAVQTLQAQHAHRLVNVHNKAGLAALEELKHRRAKPGQGKKTGRQGAGIPDAVKARRAQQYAEMRATLDATPSPPPAPEGQP